MNWNFSEAIYQLGHSAIAGHPALLHEGQTVSYAELARRAMGIASWLDTLGLAPGAHVGHYFRNCSEYLETFFGSALAGLSHLNVNYRYVDAELVDLCCGLDVRVLAYHTEFADVVARIREHCPEVVAWIEAGSDTPVNDFAVSLGALYSHDSSTFQRRTSPDDLMLIATGGTTGLPKGTQWRHEDMWYKSEVGAGRRMLELQLEQHPASMEEHVANVCRLAAPGPVFPLAPLMHGTGLLLSIQSLAQGMPVLTMAGRTLDAGRAIDLIAEHSAELLVIVGDPFALPLLEALQPRADSRPLSSLKMIFSSGALFSKEHRDVFQAQNPDMLVLDGLGSSESIGFGIASAETGVFVPMQHTRVLDDEMRDIKPGSGTVGMAYSGGHVPVGYYKEPEKSAETFVELDGQRYVKTGDRCTVREDGMLVLLGRDSNVINTGGEKVYTVEVERVLIAHPRIDDAIVIGMPHPRFGSMVVALVQAGGAHAAPAGEDELKQFARQQLADYKTPRHVFTLDSLQRTANGKPDYAFLRACAEQQLAHVNTTAD